MAINKFGDGSTSRDYTFVEDKYFDLIRIEDRTAPAGGEFIYSFSGTNDISSSNEEAIREYTDAENRVIVMKYKVRVDKAAVEGPNGLKIGYTSNKFSDVSIIESFEISVVGIQTNFDAVIQESTASDVSIAIANVGKYTANSVVVRIPDEEHHVRSLYLRIPSVKYKKNSAFAREILDRGDSAQVLRRDLWA